MVMLVEDDADDEELTLRALRRANVTSEILVARDGEEAMDYLFAEGAHAEREHPRHARSGIAGPEAAQNWRASYFEAYP